MNTSARIGLLAMLMFLISCGSSAKQVRYVYLDAPEYSSEKAQIQAINDAHAAPAAQATTVSTRPAANTGSSSTKSVSPSTQNPRQRIRQLAETKVEGYFRGYGTYIADDEDFAIDMAQANALEKLTNQFAAKLQTELKRATAGKKATTVTKGETAVRKLLAEFTIYDWYVKDSYVSNGPTYEAIYCIEVKAENIIPDLMPYFEGVDKDVVDAVMNGMRRGDR